MIHVTHAQGSQGPRSRAFRLAVLATLLAAHGLWDVAHALAHHESDHHSGATALSRLATDSPPAFDATHDHGHSHPDLALVVLAAKVQQPVALLHAAGTSILPANGPSLRLRVQEVWARAAPQRADPLGPRAPPIA